LQHIIIFDRILITIVMCKTAEKPFVIQQEINNLLRRHQSA